MSTLESRWDLSDIEVSKSGLEAALRVAERLTRDKDKATGQWETAIRLAQSNGASLREIAQVTGVSPQTIANICNR